MEALESHYKLSIPPYYFSLINPEDPNDPIRLQSVSSPLELENPSGYELEDPRLTLVTVTEVRVADDLRDASVYVTVSGDEKEHQTALRALQHAAPYVRKQLGFALNLRHTPALHFVRDTVEEKAERVSSILEKIEPK